MNITKPKTKLNTKEKEAYSKLSDSIGGAVLQLGYNALDQHALNQNANVLRTELHQMKVDIIQKYGCKEVDFKNNKLIY